MRTFELFKKIVLKVRNLSIQSGQDKRRLLDKVGFEVGKKEIHCILGKNGSGKTTLAKAIMGLGDYEIQSGKITFGFRNIIKKKPNERAKMGITLAFQEPARFEGLTVKDFLTVSLKLPFSSKLRRTSKIQISKLLSKKDEIGIAKILNLVGLGEDILERKIDDKLSGGERKRIELASVILMKPKLMILDEPDASLDIVVYNELYDLLLNIKKEIGCGIILITHREEAGLIADRATLLDKGRVIKTGRFREVMREYCKKMGVREKCIAYKLKH